MLYKKCLLVGIFTLLSVSLATADPPAVHPTTLEPLVIDCLRGTPDAIDGDLSDWNLEAMTPAVLDVVEQLHSGQDSWTGPEDCGGEFYLLWDDVNIYIAVVVKDDKLSMNKTDGNIWNADAIEVFFSTLNAVAGHAEHYQYGFNANNQRWNWCNMDGAGSTEPEYLQIASSATADGYICEASIEYGQMPSLDFSVGNTIGFHPVFDDTDNGDRELQMTWTGREAHDQSLGFGHMVLSADSVSAIDMEIGFGTPVIDGEVDDIWADAAEASFVPLEDPADGSGIWKVLYDTENLYVLVDVTDDILQNDTASSWQDDSVEIYFDGGNTKLSTALSGDDHQYTFGWTTDDIQGTNVTGYTEGIEHAQATTDTGWRIEVKMPWMSIWGVEPQAGDLIGIDCYYNDDDDGGDSREGKMLSFSAIEGWNDASQWGTAVLAAELVPVDPGTDGLLAYYALDGDPNDSSGNGIDGTVYNADTGGLGDGGSVWVDDPERGTVISFNGTADGAHVRAGEIPQMTLTNDFTWAFWAKHSDENTADNDIILGNRMDENAVDFVPRQFIKFTPTKFEWHMNGNGDDNLDYEDIPADIWLHHAVVKTGDQLTYYRNGIEHSSGTFTQPLDFPQPLFFGGDNEGAEGENWSGLMSDVCIYDRALSDGEISYLAGERARIDPGTDGLIALYAFENDTTDGSGNGLDGTIVGDPTFVDGIAGMALDFNGDDYVDCGTNDVLNNLSDAMTVSAWVNIRSVTTTWMGIVMKGETAWRLGVNGDTSGIHFGFTGGDRGWQAANSVTELPFGEWHHIAGTYDRSVGGTVWVDGVAETVNPDPDGVRTNEISLLLGENPEATGRLFDGLLDEVMIYNRALTEEEMLFLAD